ncbi:MAG: hypothetical protein Q9201_005682, partial [Fulgogasparrea decipioides]
MVNWKEPKAFERLLAAMVVAQDMKLDYKKIAYVFGQGGYNHPIPCLPYPSFPHPNSSHFTHTAISPFSSSPYPSLTHTQPPLTKPTGATYDSIEGRFRIIKKAAAALQAELDFGQRSPAPPRGGSSKTPKASSSSAKSSFATITSAPDEDYAGTERMAATPKKQKGGKAGKTGAETPRGKKDKEDK